MRGQKEKWKRESGQERGWGVGGGGGGGGGDGYPVGAKKRSHKERDVGGEGSAGEKFGRANKANSYSTSSQVSILMKLHQIQSRRRDRKRGFVETIKREDFWEEKGRHKGQGHK